MKNLLAKLSERVESLSTKQLLIGIGAFILILILILSLIFTYTAIASKNKKAKTATKEAISKTIADKNTEKPKEVTAEPQMSLDEVRALNNKIMSGETPSDGPLDELSRIMASSPTKTTEIKPDASSEKAVTEDATTKEPTAKPVEKNADKPKANLPISNPYNIGKKEDLGVLIESINAWNESELAELERAKKKAQQKK